MCTHQGSDYSLLVTILLGFGFSLIVWALTRDQYGFPTIISDQFHFAESINNTEKWLQEHVLWLTRPVAGVIGDPSIAPYVASKHAVIGLTKSAASAYAPEKIRVNAVGPAPIETRMMRALETGLDPGGEAAVKEALEQRIPLGRYGTPEEVASVIAFLCSEDSSFVTGSFYTVDGGMTNY